MAQSVYLVCAAKDMATVLIGSVNKEELAKVIGLPAKHIVIYTQPVGYKRNDKNRLRAVSFSPFLRLYYFVSPTNALCQMIVINPAACKWA